MLVVGQSGTALSCTSFGMNKSNAVKIVLAVGLLGGAALMFGRFLRSNNGIVGTASASQGWDPDALGNFESVTTDGITQTLVAVNGFYTITLPWATNYNTPTDAGEAAIGGMPRILVEHEFRGRTEHHKSHYALRAATMIRAGVAPDLLA